MSRPLAPTERDHRDDGNPFLGFVIAVMFAVALGLTVRGIAHLVSWASHTEPVAVAFALAAIVAAGVAFLGAAWLRDRVLDRRDQAAVARARRARVLEQLQRSDYDAAVLTHPR